MDAGGISYINTAAECLDRMRSAQKLVKKHGEIIEVDGRLRSNPANKVELDSRNGFLSAMRMLNLDTEPFNERPGRPASSFRPVSKVRN